MLRVVVIVSVLFMGQLASSQTSDSTDYETRAFVGSAGIERKYLLRLPMGFLAGDCAHVVFDFHGATGTAEGEFRYSNFPSIADREGFVLVHPDANKHYVDQNHPLATYWNSAWEAVKRERDYDVNFILELVASLQDEFCTQQFYATGMSAGGDISSALACLADTPFAAFAPVTYRYYYTEECADAGPRPMLSFQGDADRIVPIEGSGTPWFDPPMQEIMARWARHNGCASEPTQSRVSTEVLHYTWSGCTAATEWYLIEGGGHTWPGGPISRPGSHVTQDISASELIWTFFQRYP